MPDNIIPGTKTLLIGPTGVGKTYSVRTYIDAGVTPFVISIEPGIASTLGDIPCPDLHWMHISPTTDSWAALIDNAKKINTLSNDALQKLPGMGKSKYTQFIDILNACNSFTCDRCGTAFGDIATWSTDRVIVFDGLTGMSAASKNLAVGAKPIVTQPDWGVSMDNLERTLDAILNGTLCHVLLIAHPEMERDEITGRMLVMVSSLGRKLPPKIPPKFDDVVLAVREATQFTWSTAETNVDLKARNLPIQAKLPPTFTQIIDAWQKKGGKIIETSS